jgi:hypothetical protein
LPAVRFLSRAEKGRERVLRGKIPVFEQQMKHGGHERLFGDALCDEWPEKDGTIGVYQSHGESLAAFSRFAGNSLTDLKILCGGLRDHLEASRFRIASRIGAAPQRCTGARRALDGAKAWKWISGIAAASARF